MATLINKGVFNGNYIDDNIEANSTESIVKLVDGLAAAKTADRTQWANGEMEYTIVITNSTDNNYENPTFTDEIDSTLATLVDNSVIVNDSTTVYDFTDGTLTVALPTIPPQGNLTIKFKVVRV